MNEKLFGVYDTWTSVISVVLILVSVVGIAVPIYANLKIDKKVKEVKETLKKEFEIAQKRQLQVNNALMLAASQEYATANELLRVLLKEEPENLYLHLVIGRNVFHQYMKADHKMKRSDDELQEMEEGLRHFIYVAEHSGQQENYYLLGSVFPDNIAHELCVLTIGLIEYSLVHKGVCHYHQLTVEVIKAVEKILNISCFDDIANYDQTNVFIMNYVALNYYLAKSYMHYGNIKAQEQYEYALKLYSISNELDYQNQKQACKKALDRLKEKNTVVACI